VAVSLLFLAVSHKLCVKFKLFAARFGVHRGSQLVHILLRALHSMRV